MENSAINIPSKRPKIFYGWWLVLVCVLAQAVSFGMASYAYSVIASSLEEEFRVGRSSLMMGVTGLMLMMAFLSPKIGSLMDTISMRRIMIPGGCIMGFGFVLLSYASNIWHVVICYTVFISLGMATVGPLCASTLLARWFNRNRGIALGIAGLGTQFGGLLFPPLVAFLIELLEWRMALRILGAAIIVLLPLMLYWSLVSYPEDKGLAPDGDEYPPGTEKINRAGDRAVPQIAIPQVLRNRNFWIITLLISVAFGAQTVVLSNLALFGMDVGVSRERAAFLISILSIMGMISSPLLGRVADFIDVRWVMGGVMMTGVVCLSLYIFADTYGALMAITVVIGFSGGGLLPLWGVMIGRMFDVENFGRVMGTTSPLIYSFTAISPFLAGTIYDTTGSYRAVFMLMIGLLLAAAVTLPFLKRAD